MDKRFDRIDTRLDHIDTQLQAILDDLRILKGYAPGRAVRDLAETLPDLLGLAYVATLDRRDLVELPAPAAAGDLFWQAPTDYGGSYRILRGSSPKTLGDHATIPGSGSADLGWKENINVNDRFHYAVAGTGTGLRSLAAKVEAGSNTLSPRPLIPPAGPMPTLSTTLSGVNVRSSPAVLNEAPDNNRVGQAHA